MANKQKPVVSKQIYSMNNFLVSCYLLIMFAFFELFLTNGYYSVRTDKYWFFIVLTCALAVGVTVVSIANNFGNSKDTPKLQTPFFKMSVTDYAFVAFLVFAYITTLFSDYVSDSITGNAGRNNGLILLSMYLIAYIIVSRFFYYKEYVLVSFIIGGYIVSALAIVNFYYFDPLGIFANLDPRYKNNFGSTIGNKNYIAIYMCIFLAVALMMFVIYNKRYMKILCGVGIVLAYLGLLTAGSNSGYIGLFAMLFAMIAVCIRKPKYICNLMLGITIMFASGLILRLVAIFLPKNKGYESIGEELIYGTSVFYIIAVLAVITVALYLIQNTKFATNHWPKNTLTITVVLVALSIVGVFAYLMYYYTFVDTTKDLGALNHLLRFDERWGTHRGVMWIGGMEEYLKFDIFDKLFGSGCDTFYHVFEPHFGELYLYGGDTDTNCAHNEYLNYLVTQGALGLLSYLTIIITTIYRAFKNSKNTPLILVFVMPVIAYCAQAVVNIYQPVNTPFLIIFIALCEALSRKSCNINHM